MFNTIKQIPITMAIVLVTVVAFLVPSMADGMMLDLSQPLFSQIGQMFSCHLLHWSFEHFAWDLFMFVLVGAICERRSCWGYLIVLAVSAILIPIFVAELTPTLGSYRGLSGLDTGIFTFAAILLIKEALHEKNLFSAGVYAVMLLGLIGKTVFELVGGSTLFVESSAFTPVPIAHIVGAMVGAFVAFGQRMLPSGQIGNGFRRSDMPAH